MKTLSGSALFHFAICSGLILLAACSESPDSNDGISSDKGSIAFSIVWKSGITENVALLPFKVDCSDIGVATVKAVSRVF